MESVNLLDRNGADATGNRTVIESSDDIDEIRRHVKEIEESGAFKGSRRSRLFLEHIVEKAIAGDFEALKERLIGAELFGRSPSYNTGDDSIVRVTASHVRKRLLSYYAKHENASKFHVSLPPGSYLLEITRCSSDELRLSDAAHAHGDLAAHPEEPLEPQHVSSPISEAKGEDSAPFSAARAESFNENKNRKRWLAFCALLGVVNLAIWGIFWVRPARRDPLPSVLPWSAFFDSPRTTTLITSDPDLAGIESVTGKLVSVSDYANHHFMPEKGTLAPGVDEICRSVLIGNKSAALDVPIAANVARVALASSREIDVRVARSVQLTDLYNTNNNFIFLGSPRSDPWVYLFNDQLDFRLVTPQIKGGHDFIVNAHPRGHELPVYNPTATHGITGQTFAIVAFLPSLSHAGHVLLLAGADGEGTEAAGKFVVDLPRLTTALRECGISPLGPVRHFEFLLGLNTMASSATSTDVVACHILPDAPSQRP